MNLRSPWFMVSVLCAVLAITGYLAWPYFFEKRMSAVRDISLESLNDPMLAVTRLLAQRDYTVRKQETLTLALGQALPKGTMLLSDSGGRLTEEQLEELLKWVGEGNVLITKPKFAGYANKKRIIINEEDLYSGSENLEHENTQSEEHASEDYDQAEGDAEESELEGSELEDSELEESEAEEYEQDPQVYELDEDDKGYVSADPLSDYLGVFLEYAGSQDNETDKSTNDSASSDTQEESDNEQEQIITKRPFTEIALPSVAYPLQFAQSDTLLNGEAEYEAPKYTDSHGGHMRIYAEGSGYIVLITENNYHNEVLQHLDHGELLWHLLQLNPNHKQLLIVDHLEMPTWYQALWSNFYYMLIAAIIALLLILWRAMRRFGPLLPEPSLERRAQMEHVLASARWLWRLPQGRRHLLTAAQADTLALILRRAPELTRLSEDDKWQRIARDCALPLERIKQAFNEQTGAQPNYFTQQIQTLQQLRKHYER